MIDKAMGSDADAIILDLEDGVPPGSKPEARKLIADALDRPRAERDPVRFVRSNPIGSPDASADLDAVVRPGLTGLVLPKVESAHQVGALAELLVIKERRVGLVEGSIALVVSIENPRGLLDAPALAPSSPRNVAILFGAEDFTRELGLPVLRKGEARELLYARSTIAVAAAAHHLQAIDGIWPELQDAEGLQQDCGQARRLGFSGKSAIHPSQIPVINAAFTPTAEEVRMAQEVIAAYEEARARGQAAAALDGQLVDLPIVERARQTLRLSETVGARDSC